MYTRSEMSRPLFRVLSDLSRRERWLLAGRAAGQVLGAVGLAGVLAVVLVLLRVPRPTAASVLVGLAAAGMAFALGYPAALQWRGAGRRARQAALVERVRPQLRGRLLTVAERLDGPGPGESALLLARAEERAGVLLQDLDPRQVHPLRPLVSTWAAAAFAALIAAITALGPVGPGAAVRLLLTPPGGSAAEAAPPQAPPRDHVLLGDIVIRYRYPAYTGLDPLEVPNSTGDVHGPPGTQVEVRARTAEPYERAELVLAVEDGAPEGGGPATVAAVLEGGRDVAAAFEITVSGTWSFGFYRGADRDHSRPFEIRVEADLAPEVVVDLPSGSLEVAWDQPIPGQWVARDDYGVVRVEALTTGTTGERRDVVRTPLDPVPRVTGDLSLSPRDLGLRPGQEATLQVVAWDNDAISGSKAGASRPLRLVVLGPRGLEARKARVVKELRDALVLVLADHLEEAWPREARGPVLLDWGQEVARRLEPVERLAESIWEGFDAETFEGTVVAEVRRAHGSAVAFAQALGSHPSVQGADLATLEGLRTRMVEQTEEGILTLDQAVRMAALIRLNELAAQVAREADVLAAMDDAEAAELLARLDRLERQLARLAQAAADLGEGNLSDFVNDRARDAANVAREIRQALSQGRTEEARRMLDQLARDLRSLAEQVQDMQVQGDERSGEALAAARELRDELATLEREQRTLAERSGDLSRRRSDGAADDAWEDLQRQAEALAEELDRLETREAEAGGWGLERRRVESAGAQARDAARALEARDLQGAWSAASGAEESLDELSQDRVQHEEFRRQVGYGAPLDPELRRAEEGALEQARDLRRALDRWQERRDALPRDVAEALEPAARSQEDLERRTKDARSRAQELAPNLPMGAPGLDDGLDQATRRQEQARDALRRGRPEQGQGAQESAAEGIAEAREALDRAMRDAEDMARFGRAEGEEMAEGRPDERREHGRGTPEQRQGVEIPAPEEFQTPEEYRHALLEGMEADVPDEYEALKRRYYEELVRQ